MTKCILTLALFCTFNMPTAHALPRINTLAYTGLHAITQAIVWTTGYTIAKKSAEAAALNGIFAVMDYNDAQKQFGQGLALIQNNHTHTNIKLTDQSVSMQLGDVTESDINTLNHEDQASIRTYLNDHEYHKNSAYNHAYQCAKLTAVFFASTFATTGLSYLLYQYS